MQKEYTREFGGNDRTVLYPSGGRSYRAECVCLYAQTCVLKNVNCTVSKFYFNRLHPSFKEQKEMYQLTA